MTPTESQAREEMCRVGRSLFERGYVHATAGNISVRLDDGFLITPTDACLGFLNPARLAKLDLQGQQLSGDKGSKTIALHRQIYAAACESDTDTRCVIHTHSTHCVALSLNAHGPELLPPITPYFVMKVGHVPLVRYHRPGSPDAAHEVAALIRSHDAAAPGAQCVARHARSRHGHARRTRRNCAAHAAATPHPASAGHRPGRTAPNLWRPLVTPERNPCPALPPTCP
jgi:ribulose-5-phosphate 4-epimerase/fuculose-1-phosphate aldolase